MVGVSVSAKTAQRAWLIILSITLEEELKVFDFVCGFFCFFFFFFFRAVPEAYGSSLARGQIGTAAAGLCTGHSNVGSKPCL